MVLRYMKRCAFLSCLVLAAGSIGSTASAHVTSPLLDGTLVQAQGDNRVYYIQGTQKRWVSSEQAFLGQGFRWADIATVEPGRLASVPDGAEITASPYLGLTMDRSLLPDLAPVAPYDIRYAVESGETRLRFTATFWNRGKGAFELKADAGTQLGDGNYNATQMMFQTDGGIRERSVGTLFWHDIHSHYHYDEFGSYVLEMVRPAAGSAVIAPVQTVKTTFCMRDDQLIGAPSEGPKQARKYGGCDGHTQGVSVGWADVYPHTLPDQYFNVTGLPAGLYKMIWSVDPHGHFAEIRRDNNVAMTFVELDPARRYVRVIGTASPYEASTNRFPDGTLVQAEGDSKVYVISKNKKRWIRNEQVFRSYGFSFANILMLPKRVVEVMPSEALVRVSGTSAVYALNVAGFKRRIASPEIMTSYGWSGADVIDINQTEFDSIPTTDLIVKRGEDRIYSLSQSREVGTFGSLRSLGLDPDSVHGVNEREFQSYAVSQVATGLVIPWDIAFLPDGDMLVTERTGTVRRIGKRAASFPIANVYTAGEGGLMGIVLHPEFATNNLVYLYYTTDDGGRKNRVARFRLETDKLVLEKIIMDGIPSAMYHDGGQIDFGPDGKLYVATGDATTPESAQDTRSLAGKILRLNADGSIPSDNPFGNAVWSYGHRNPQGFAWAPDGTMYASEHGPTGEFSLCCRDEINRIERGANYGWPAITGDQHRAGMMSPVLSSGYTETWAPSGLAYKDGKLLFSGLRALTLFEVTLNGEGEMSAWHERITDTYGRLRAAVIGPDGALYLTTSNRDGRGTPKAGDDKILRIRPDFLR